MCELINLPAHRDGLHFQRSDNKKSRELVEDKSGIRECNAPGRFGIMWSSHRRAIAPHNDAASKYNLSSVDEVPALGGQHIEKSLRATDFDEKKKIRETK